jgi:hypothetical protein
VAGKQEEPHQKTRKSMQPGQTNHTVLQITNKINLLNHSHHGLDVYDDSLVQIYPMRAIHDIIPEGGR